MRILMSIHHGLDVNTGAPGVTARLAAALRGRGHDVDVISFDRLRGPERLKPLAFPWYVAGYVARHPEYDVLDLSSGDGWLASFLPAGRNGWRPVVVARSHGLEHTAHEARLRAAQAGALHLSWKYPLYHGGFRLWECRTSFARADAALLLNDADRACAIAYLGVQPPRAIRIRNGIADPLVARARALLEMPAPRGPPCNIAFIGRYEPMKGSAQLAAAMGRLLAERPGARLGLFGTMRDAAAILPDYPEALHGRIQVVPTFDNAALPRLLEDFHVLAFPSLSEGFGAAVVEAMACGLVPVVAAAPGPVGFVRHGQNGLVVPVGDAAALHDAVARLLDDQACWQALRGPALRTALDHSWANVAAEAEAIYRRLSSAER